MDGVIDTNTSNLSIKDRLDLLRERRSSWENLQWKKFPAENFSGSYHAYDFAGGVYAILEDSNDFTDLTLPTKTCEGSRKSHHLDFLARDFAMEPTQDLLIFLAEQAVNDPDIDLYVRTYESIIPHPHSEQSHILVHSEGRPHAFMLQIADNHFALAWNDLDETELNIRIWDWRSGQLIHEQTLMDSGGRAESFTFLSPKTFAIGVKKQSGYISIWNLDSGAEDSRLCFPEMIDGEWCIHRVSVDTPPFVARPRPDRIFTVSPTHRIHTFSLSYAWLSTGSHSLRVYVPNGFLLSCATRSSEQDHTDIDVPWEDWGPRNSRIREAGPRDYDDSHCFGYGCRILLPLAKDGQVHILDFNLTQGIAEDSLLSDCSVSVPSPTTISCPWIFKQDIITYLPYTLRLRALPDSLSVQGIILRMDECHIVAVDLLSAESDILIHPMAI